MVTLKSRITNFSDNFFYLREKDSKTFLWNISLQLIVKEGGGDERSEGSCLQCDQIKIAKCL